MWWCNNQMWWGYSSSNLFDVFNDWFGGCVVELINAISMFGYTVVFGVIGLILYSMFKNNRMNRRKGDK